MFGKTLNKPVVHYQIAGVGQEIPPSLQLGWEQLEDKFVSPLGAVLFGCTALLVAAHIWGAKKGKVATAYWGGSQEKGKAAKKAKKQIKNVARNSVALFIGTPAFIRSHLEQEWVQRGRVHPTRRWEKALRGFFSASPTLYVPDAQRGISVCGGAGTGKTYSVIDPLVRSAFDQGFPVCLYDFKYPAQTLRAVAYALKRGYNVRVFAPGFAESESCNPLDFLRDEEDAVAAGQLAEVINRNFDRGGADNGDRFFSEAGDTLVAGVLMLTKAVGRLRSPQYCDLMMAQAILSLDQLPQRLELASKNGTLKVWTSRPLSQLISVKDSEKTVAGILGTAQRIFQRFLKKDFVGAFCGKTTLPLDLDGKQLIVFGLDRNNRDIVGPLLAAILHMGEQEIQFRSKSLTRSAGKGGRSHSLTDHHQKRYLLEPSEFLKLGTGRAVVVNPGYQRGQEAYVPVLQSIKVPPADIAQQKWSEGKWDVIKRRLIERNHCLISDDERREQFEERRALAEKLFPLPQVNPEAYEGSVEAETNSTGFSSSLVPEAF